MKVADLVSAPPKILIYAGAGTGKTALALTLGASCLYLDLDDNMDVAFGLKDNLQKDRLSVEVEQFLDTPRRTQAFTQLKQRVFKIAQECHNGTFEYKVLVLDSLTSLAVAAQNMVMAGSNKVGDNPQIQHWGLLLTEIENVVTILRSLPIIVFMLAHETTFTSDDISKIQIAIPGQKLPGRITRMFNEIWYFRSQPKGEGIHQMYIQTVPTSTVTCRSGRGLKTGTPFATIDKQGNPTASIGLWTILSQLQERSKEAATAVTT